MISASKTKVLAAHPACAHSVSPRSVQLGYVEEHVQVLEESEYLSRAISRECCSLDHVHVQEID